LHFDWGVIGFSIGLMVDKYTGYSRVYDLYDYNPDINPPVVVHHHYHNHNYVPLKIAGGWD
jgi:hypothetical protein